MEIESSQSERLVIRLAILVYWSLFWFLNVVDKIIPGAIFLWVGKDRYAQLESYFASIGVEEPMVIWSFLGVTTVLETIAFVLVFVALLKLLMGKLQKAHSFFFWGTIVGLVVFTFFSIGDQIFGDRVELLEHTIFWMALIVSWWVYRYFPKGE